MKMSYKILTAIACAVFLFLLPRIVTDNYVIHLLIISMIYSILTISLNIVSGFMGAISIGHAAFYGIGAYSCAILMTKVGFSFLQSGIAAILVSASFGLLLAIPSLRLRSSYLIITTIAFGNIINLIFINWTALTRGPMGITGIPSPSFSLFSKIFNIDTRVEYFYLVVIVLLLVYAFYYRLLNSRTGRAIVSVREDDIASETIGIDVVYYKVFSFVVGCSLAGLAGALYATYIRFLSPESFAFGESVTILIMLIAGGIGTLIGPIVGAFFITILLEELRFLDNYRLIIYGGILFLVIFIFPKGLIGLLDLVKGFLINRSKKYLNTH